MVEFGRCVMMMVNVLCWCESVVLLGNRAVNMFGCVVWGYYV